jgi:hypothetical protein
MSIKKGTTVTTKKGTTQSEYYGTHGVVPRILWVRGERLAVTAAGTATPRQTG